MLGVKIFAKITQFKQLPFILTLLEFYKSVLKNNSEKQILLLNIILYLISTDLLFKS